MDERIEKLRIYAIHCARMAEFYVRTHRRWIWYSTMAHAKHLQANILAKARR